jgi:uncharacterized protein
MLESENPFVKLKSRTLFLYFILINIAVANSTGFVATLLGLNSRDPIVTYIMYCLSFGILCLLALRQFKEFNINLQHIIGKISPGYNWLRLVGLVIAVLVFSIGSALLTFYVLSLIAPDFFNSLLKFIQDSSKRSSALPGLQTWLEVFTAIIVAPIVEEFLFRGILLHRWVTKWGRVPGILTTSILFGFLHVNPIGLSMFGVVMALLYIKTRTLIVPAIAHALNNTIAVLPMVLNHSNTAQSKATYSDWRIGALLIALSAPFLIRFIYKKWPNSNVLLPYWANSLKSANS